MEKEFKLSDKLLGAGTTLLARDVREFIRLLKDDFCSCMDMPVEMSKTQSLDYVIEKIDKLSGFEEAKE